MRSLHQSSFIFRHYCNTVWELPKGFDESLCIDWKCPINYYPCLSGHCVALEHLHLFYTMEWQCPDATDSIGFFNIDDIFYRSPEGSLRDLVRDRIYNILNNFVYFEFSLASIFCNYTTEYRCILANVNDSLNFKINRPCINLTQIGDGIIDCYGGLDERNLLYCGSNIYEQRGFDFHCSDQECIPYQDLCSKRCSNNADSILCDDLKTLWNSSCEYPTRSELCSASLENNCDPFGIQGFYCDGGRQSVIVRASSYRMRSWAKVTPKILINQYLTLANSVSYHVYSIEQNETIDVNHEKNDSYDENDGEEGWICGGGVAVRNNQLNRIQCFCPPNLYGEFCQYFSDRITVIISFNNIPLYISQDPSNTIKILALFLSNDTIIDHFIFHVPFILPVDLYKKFRFNFIYPRPKVLHDNYTVRFEAYYLNMDSSIRFLAIWKYRIQFPFLPSYRLVQILRFEQQSSIIAASHICKTANPCPSSSTCHPIMNLIDDTSAYYCHHNKSSVICSKSSLQRTLTSSKSICLCPIQFYGPTCHLKHSCITSKPCGINRGQCYINPDNVTHDYICICEKKYFGERCHLNSAIVEFNFTDISFIQTPSKFILSSIIQLYDLDYETLDIIIRQKRVYHGLPPTITQIYHNNHYLPMFASLKLYHKQDLINKYLADLIQPDYFILYILSSKISRVNVTSMVNRINYCPYTPIAFYKNISDFSYLLNILKSYKNYAKKDFNATIMVFQYHTLCNNSYSLMCFHDDNYFCICDKYKHAECSRYNSKLDQCEGRCRANGQCIHGDQDNRKDFVCLCPQCYYGSVCQHNTKLFSFTLETLLTDDLLSSNLVTQRIFISLLIVVPILLLIIAIASNICCYVTFNRLRPLQVGIGHYMRTASIINQLAVFILLLKLIHVVLSMKGIIVNHLLNIILCKILSYLVSCTSRMSYWLMGMVAIERVYVTWYLKGIWLKSPRIAKRIIGLIVIGILIFDIHELIYYQSIEDPKSFDINKSSWCVTSYPFIIGVYNQVNIVLNYIIPFLINLLSTIILIFLTLRKKRATAVKTKEQTSTLTFSIRAYTNFLITNKELILAPSVTMIPQLFSLPQFILSFSFACQEFQLAWQRYLLIISYFTTYLPQVLSYKLYISPSTFYKDEFHQTKLYHKISQWNQHFSNRTQTRL